MNYIFELKLFRQVGFERCDFLKNKADYADKTNPSCSNKMIEFVNPQVFNDLNNIRI